MSTVAPAPLPASFWRFWSAAALSNLGDGVRLAAFPLLAAALTQDARLVAGLAVAQYLPWLLFGLPAGAVVDRVQCRRLLVGVNVARALGLVLLVLAVATQTAQLPVLYAVCFAVGLGETLYDTAAQTAMPALVGPEQLERANGRLVSATVLTNEFVGPLLGAALFAVCVLLPFETHAVLVAVAAVLLCGLPSLTRVPAGRPQQVGGGAVSWLRQDPALRSVLVLASALVAADSAWFALLVLYTTEVLALPAAAYGVLLAVGAAGGLAGALLAPRLSSRLGGGTVLVGVVAVAAVSQLALGLTAQPVLAAALLASGSGAFAVWNVAVVSLRQRLVPVHLLGRVTGAFRTCTMSAAAAGAAAGGLLAAAHGVQAPFLVGGVLLLAVLAVLAATAPSLLHHLQKPT